MNKINDESSSYDVPWEFSSKNNSRNLSAFLLNGCAAAISSEQQQINSIITTSRNDLRSNYNCNKTTTTSTNRNCTCRNNHHHNERNNFLVSSSSSSIPPPCGVKAREMKNNKQISHSAGVNQQKSDNYIVWKYRGPDSDGRPSSDYDPPWDLRVKEQKQQQTNNKIIIQKNLMEINNKKQMSDKLVLDESSGSQNSADSGVYDEPWEKHKIDRSKPTTTTTKTTVNFFKNGGGGHSSCNPSPSTSRSNSSSQENNSLSSGESRETLNLVRKTNETSTRSVSSSAESSSSGVCSSSTLVMETTAFCSTKSNKCLISNENNRLQDVRDRLIQQLCYSNSSSTDVTNNSSFSIIKQQPVPAVRRSKLTKSAEETNDDLSSVKTTNKLNSSAADRRSVDNVLNNRIDKELSSSISLSTSNFDVSAGESSFSGENNLPKTTTNVEVYDIPWEFSQNGCKLEQLKNRLNQQQRNDQDESKMKKLFAF